MFTQVNAALRLGAHGVMVGRAAYQKYVMHILEITIFSLFRLLISQISIGNFSHSSQGIR